VKSGFQTGLERRRFLTGLGAASVPLLVTGLPVQAAPKFPVTPRQSEGPFYPTNWAGDIDWDLVRVQGEAAEAMGQVTYITGRIRDRSGSVIPQAKVEIWQCDGNGRYRHPRDRRANPRDIGFQGRGRALTDDQGRYRFRTIRPVPYPGRTPHIHFAVRTPSGPRLVTQMYVRGDPGNRRDSLLNSIRNRKVRERLLVDLNPADRLETGALAGTFDIVLDA